MKNYGTDQTKYWQAIVDKRKALLMMVSRLWMVAMTAVAGILLGVAIYFLYHGITDGIEYKAVSEFYLDFATDETGEVYQYYNGYTWNDLMSTDLIASNTLIGLEGTDADINTIEDSTTAEILSDIRVLRVTIVNSDKDLCDKLQTATEESLVQLGDNAKEFNDISVIKTTSAQRVYADNRILQAIQLGLILGVLVGLLLVWFVAILDDRILVASDLYGTDIPVLGTLSRNTEGRYARYLNRIYETNINSLMSSLSDAEKDAIEKVNALELQEKLLEGGEIDLQTAKNIILLIPYAKMHQRTLVLLVDAIRQSGRKIYGFVIEDGADSFYKAYYSL